jgi:3-oxoacyl-[acyl-carrier protein] reductase
MTDEQWSMVLDRHLTGTFRCLRAVLPHMYERGGGAVVNNASVLGWRAQELQAHYAAAKAGVMALTRSAAMEAAKHDVRINAVAPSLAMHAFLEKVTPDGLLDQLRGQEAFGRGAEPWEVANDVPTWPATPHRRGHLGLQPARLGCTPTPDHRAAMPRVRRTQR